MFCYKICFSILFFKFCRAFCLKFQFIYKPTFRALAFDVIFCKFCAVASLSDFSCSRFDAVASLNFSTLLSKTAEEFPIFFWITAMFWDTSESLSVLPWTFVWSFDRFPSISDRSFPKPWMDSPWCSWVSCGLNLFLSLVVVDVWY